jgi:hypothetical protein
MTQAVLLKWPAYLAATFFAFCHASSVLAASAAVHSV